MPDRPFTILGCTIYDMRWSHAKWPRRDGGRWLVRDSSGDVYSRWLVSAAWAAVKSAMKNNRFRPVFSRTGLHNKVDVASQPKPAKDQVPLSTIMQKLREWEAQGRITLRSGNKNA